MRSPLPPPRTPLGPQARSEGPHRPFSLRFSLGVLGLITALGAFGPWLAPYDPDEQLDVNGGRLRPPLTHLHAIEQAHGVWRLADRVERTADGLRYERLGNPRTLAASEVRNLTDDGVADRRFFLLGSDAFGRDILSRWLHGARVSLLIGILSVGLAMTLGVLVGSLAALGPRWLDGLLMRLVDGLLAFPWLFLVITLGALFHTSPTTLILVLGGTSWMSIARLTRGEVLGLSERGFVQASRAMGAATARTLWRHLLPNALPPLLIAATLRIGNLILFEAVLSYLGLGVQPPHASWGNMIAEGREHLASAWWITTFPGLALVLTVLALNLMGDELRTLLDPRSAESRNPANPRPRPETAGVEVG